MDNQFIQKLSRRMLLDDGWHLYCIKCGKYLHESKFIKDPATSWGYKSSCNKCKNVKSIDLDDTVDMKHLKLSPLKERDFIETQVFLEAIGYDFHTNMTVHEQFMKKHGLK